MSESTSGKFGRGACALAGAATVLVALAACGSGEEAAPPTVTETGAPVTQTSTDASLASSTESSEPTATTTVTEETSTKPSTSTSTNADGVPVPAAERRCQAAQLQITALSGDSGAGSTYRELEFRNVSQSECQMAGYPGVSATDSEGGEQIGEPAGRSQEPSELLTLGSGDTATATLRSVNMGDGGSPLEGCEPRPAAGVNVFSPGLEESIFVRIDNFHACTGNAEFMTVSPVRGGGR